MKSYSQDLRDRVIAKYNSGEYSKKVIAQIFNLSRHTVSRWVKRYKETGGYSSLHGVGSGRPIKFNDKSKILEYLKSNPDASGNEMRQELAPSISMTTFYNALARMEITYKKKSQNTKGDARWLDASL
jgi:transposase